MDPKTLSLVSKDLEAAGHTSDQDRPLFRPIVNPSGTHGDGYNTGWRVHRLTCALHEALPSGPAVNGWLQNDRL
jgi:hypothetical protein